MANLVKAGGAQTHARHHVVGADNMMPDFRGCETTDFLYSAVLVENECQCLTEENVSVCSMLPLGVML